MKQLEDWLEAEFGQSVKADSVVFEAEFVVEHSLLDSQSVKQFEDSLELPAY